MSALTGYRKKMVHVIIFFGFAVQALTACAEIGAFPVKDSGRTSGSIYGWLDNERVLFYNKTSSTPNLRANLLEGGPSIWNVSTDTLTTDNSLKGGSNFCVGPEGVTFLRKSLEDENKWLVVTKDKDGESETPFVNSAWFNRFTCRYYNEKPEWLLAHHETLPLLDEHGFLDWPPSEGPSRLQNQPLRFHRKSYSGWIELPIGTREVWRGDVRYSSFKNSYFLYPITYIDPQTGKEEPVGPWPEGKPVKVRWLAPDGSVTSETVPYMRFMRGGSRGYFPTREGVFIYSHKTDDVAKPGDAGAYLAQDGRVTKLITGLVDNVSVSPDGCRVAFIHDPYDTIYGIDRLERITVKVINLCQGNRHDR